MNNAAVWQSHTSKSSMVRKRESEEEAVIATRVSGLFFACLVLAMPAVSAGQESRAAPVPPPVQIAAADHPSAADQPSGTQPQLQQRYPRYVVHRQDVLLLSFPLSPELNQTVMVQPDGYINLQSAASVHVEGLTVPEMVDAVKKAYAGTLNEPIINIDLEDFQKPLFTVTGQVGKPGQYELRTPLTVSEAIAVAGGLEPTAKTQIFLFRKTSNNWFEVEKLNLKEVMQGKNVNEDAAIQPGDMIVVPESFITKFKRYVPYTVNAGTYISPTQF
jgi:polysaccharide biosynthesis/export protein